MRQYRAQVVRVVDADTVDLLVDLGFGIKKLDRFRLYGPDPEGPMGLNAPERNTPEGKVAIEYLKHMFQQAGVEVTLQTVRNDKQEKFGRYLAVLFIWNSRNVNQLLIDNGHAFLREYALMELEQ